MDPLTVWRAALRRDRSCGLLYSMDFTGEIDAQVRRHFAIPEDVGTKAFLGLFEPADVQPAKRLGAPVHDFRPYFATRGIPPGAWIEDDGVMHVPGSVHHFTRMVSPLKEADSFEEIRAFSYRDPSDYDFSGMEAAVASAHAQGRVARCWVGRLYESAWPIRGYEEFLMDMAAEPEWSDYILDRMLAWDLACATEAARAGVDVLYFGDDVANQNDLMFSREMWRAVLMPRWRRIFDAARAIRPDVRIWYHSDGNITDIVPDLVELGVDFLNPVQPECMDVHAIQARFGDRIIIDGGLGTQTVLPFGTPEEVREAVRDLALVVGRSGGLVLAPSHVVEPEVPLANVLAFLEAARDFCGPAAEAQP